MIFRGSSIKKKVFFVGYQTYLDERTDGFAINCKSMGNCGIVNINFFKFFLTILIFLLFLERVISKFLLINFNNLISSY